MSDVRKLAQARQLLRVIAQVDTYKGPGDRRMFLVTPVGAMRARMINHAMTDDRMIPLVEESRIIVLSNNADEATALLTVLSNLSMGAAETTARTAHLNRRSND